MRLALLFPPIFRIDALDALASLLSMGGNALPSSPYAPIGTGHHLDESILACSVLDLIQKHSRIA